MQYAHAALPRFQVDPKRIAATSGVIALHVGLLMMLMMPPRIVQPDAGTDVDLVVVPDHKIEVPPLPPPPKDPPPRQPRQEQMTQTVKIAVPDPPPASVDADANAMSEQYVEPPAQPANTFAQGVAPASIFQQLATDLAPPPLYPRAAVAHRIEGKVMLRIHVDASGRPLEVSVEGSSGSSLLDEAARKWVKARWHFVPAQQDGQATDGWALVPIDFVLQ